jgi:hypothetical protein
MNKVEKTSLFEMSVQFKEIFDGATIEEATEKAHSQKSPGDDAIINIAGQRFINAKIKKISDNKNDDIRSKGTQGSGVEATKDVGKNV